MLIDFHCHHLPPALFRELKKMDLSRAPWLEKMAQAEAFQRPERRFEDMGRMGVDLQVISLPPPGVDVAPPGEARRLARLANEAMAETVSMGKGRLIGLMALPMREPGSVIEEMEYASLHLGLKGIGTFSNVAGEPLDSPAFTPVFERAQALRLPVFIHPTTPAYPEPYREFGLIPLLGFMADTALAAARMALAGTLQRLPDLKLIVPHLGSIIPFILPRFDIETRLTSSLDSDFSLSLTREPSFYLRKMWVDSVSLHGPALRCAYETMGCERIVFGSDYPLPGWWEGAVSSLEELKISHEENELIYWKNSAFLLDLSL